MFKWLKRIVIVVLLLVVIGGVVLYFSLNGILRTQIEQQSSKSLNLPTNLGGASLAIFGGDLSLQNYKVASPPGFSSQPMLELGGLDVKVSYGQLRSTPARIQSITIDSPKMLLEQKDGKFNIKAMTENLPPGKPTEPTAEGESMKLIIDQISIKDPQVTIRPGLPGLPEEIPVKLGSFEMKNVGNADGAQNGVAVKQVVTQLVTEMAAKASSSASLPAELQAILNGDLTAIAQQFIPGEAGKVIGSLINEQTLNDPGKAVGAALEDVTGGASTNPAKAVEGALKDVTGGGKPEDALKGLLGGKKDEDKKDQDKKKDGRKKQE